MAVTARPGAPDALRLGRARFLAAERVDMRAIAEELGVNRVTLYRWFGSRDAFLVEVVWSLAREALDALEAEAAGRAGADRVAAVVGGLLERTMAAAGFRRWLREEGEHAMRLLTRAEPGFQPRLIAAVGALLAREREAGALHVPLDDAELAYVVVRLLESYTYLDLITGEEPDPGRLDPVLRALLRGEAAPTGPAVGS